MWVETATALVQKAVNYCSSFCTMPHHRFEISIHSTLSAPSAMSGRRVVLAALALVLCCALADAKKKKKDSPAHVGRQAPPKQPDPDDPNQAHLAYGNNPVRNAV
jgi:hypothetical protein